MFNSASVSVKTEPIDYIDKLSRSPSPQSDNDYPSPPKLRTYQQEAVDAVLTAIEEEGLTRIGVSAPTGGGKTTIFATIIREILKDQRKGKVLVLVGSEEQAIQAKIKIEDVHGRYRPLIGHERNTQRATRRDEV
jgi:superfamily II DNA or RNA helicase